MCGKNSTEDSCQFLFECEQYDDSRNAWVSTIVTRCPDFYLSALENIQKSTAKYMVRSSLKRNVSVIDKRKI